eukprot:jgi/Bigna1/66927/fgenesh1_pg.2_\
MAEEQPPAAPWREVKTKDGRTYYWNKETNATQWSKPESSTSSLKEEMERKLDFALFDPNQDIEDKVAEKKDASDEKATLSIRGYFCKIYKDDATAMRLDQGAHLTPWNDDDEVKIDRFDVRAIMTPDMMKDVLSTKDNGAAEGGGGGGGEEGVNDKVLDKFRYADYPGWKLNSVTRVRSLIPLMYDRT